MTHAFRTTLVIAALGVAVPAGAQSKREMQMMADLRMLQEQSQQLQVSLTQINEGLTQTLKALSTRLDEQSNAIDHFYAKLFRLADRMTTAAGRAAAAKRTAFLHAFVDQLRHEIQ